MTIIKSRKLKLFGNVTKSLTMHDGRLLKMVTFGWQSVADQEEDLKEYLKMGGLHHGLVPDGSVCGDGDGKGHKFMEGVHDQPRRPISYGMQKKILLLDVKCNYY